MARQADDPDVEGEIFPAELRAVAGLLRRLEELLLHLDVAERLASLVPGRGQVVEVPRGGELHRLQARLGGGAADDEREVVRRARGGPERLHLLDEELLERGGVQQRLRLLVEVRLVRGPAPLGDEEELVLVPLRRVQVDLRGEVGPGVHLFVHRERDRLRVPHVLFRVRLVDALREVLLVPGAGPDLLPLLPDDRRGAGVLAQGEDELRRHFGVPQQRDRHAAVVRGRLGVGEDRRHLLEVLGAKEEGDVPQRLVGEEREPLGIHLEDLLAVELRGGDVLLGQEAVLCRVLPQRERVLVRKFRHRAAPSEDGMRGAGNIQKIVPRGRNVKDGRDRRAADGAADGEVARQAPRVRR